MRGPDGAGINPCMRARSQDGTHTHGSGAAAVPPALVTTAHPRRSSTATATGIGPVATWRTTSPVRASRRLTLPAVVPLAACGDQYQVRGSTGWPQLATM